MNQQIATHLKAIEQYLATPWLKRGVSVCALLAVGAGLVRGAIVGPYAPDPDTIHLWHFNEPGVPVIDVGSDGIHLTALRNVDAVFDAYRVTPS